MFKDTLPPAGPAWAGSVMGVSVASTVTGIHGLWLLSWILLAGATVLAFLLTAGWVRFRNPGFGRAFMAPWAMVSMGVSSLGTAWTSATDLWWFQIVGWSLAVPLALTVCARQLQYFIGAPTFLWGLPTVAPMVCASSGLQISRSGSVGEHASRIIWELSAAMAVLSALTAPVVFLVVYVAIVRRRTRVPEAFAGTWWIPLGVIGQSTVVSVLLGAGTSYGHLAFTVAVPLGAVALVAFLRAGVRGAAYSPAWWGSTFPVGVLALGAHSLGSDGVSAALTVLLLVHVTVCSARAAVAVRGGVATETERARVPVPR